MLVLAELLFNEDMGSQISKYSALFKKVKQNTKLLGKLLKYLQSFSYLHCSF